MTFPTAVNDQITDTVTQTNVKVLGDAPAVALGSIYQSLANSTGSAQQQLANSAQTATNQGVNQLHSVDAMAGAVATAKVAQSDVPDTMQALLTALKGAKD
ncbi:RebB family R body protein [Candidatus Methylobacter oryzae]|uniref:RebB like protein n=1 Tax=Candidatus Methylobacter oryzae TaxID=2497749 RepID=A0ABY3C9K0_9GAMM|nr:RebB family R body protein [Candidatus Methylobacter oryzae]TRW92732.1 RebB like protein [Candidatus Methylobacter oryzae]